jgi:hypothetical protein
MASRLILVRQSGLRQVTEIEVLRALEPALRELPRDSVEVDLQPLAHEIDSGDWTGHDRALRGKAAEVRAFADRAEDPTIHYFGLGEVPDVIALGAHFGDERQVHLHDFDRDRGEWTWPEHDATLDVITEGLPTGPAVTSRGDAVLRVAISAPVTDGAVDAVVSRERLADITLRVDGPVIGRVRSLANLERVRLALRAALAALREARPNVDVIHIFVAASVPVCFAVGQELKPRNSVPIQTYRFREVPGQASNTEAILLTAGDAEANSGSLTADDLAHAHLVRTEIWPEALADVIEYARTKRGRGEDTGVWYRALQPNAAIMAAAPFPELRPLAAIVPEDDSVDPHPFAGEYGYDKDAHQWRLSDQLLARFHQAVEGDRDELRLLVHLFLFHEYLHDYHSITKYTAEEVGKFANCLEYIDYTADTYALLHQLDWAASHRPVLVSDDKRRVQFLAGQIDLVIRSFWAFEPAGANNAWQVRRLRRYLNWYWRHIQVLRSRDVATALQLFARPPKIELGGLNQVARGRRVIARLDRADSSTQLELGIVLEDERLFRVQASPSTNLVALLDAFRMGQHAEIQQFFRAVFEEAQARGGALPLAK